MLTEAGVPDYDLPKDFARMRSVHLRWSQEIWYELQPISYTQIRELYVDPIEDSFRAVPAFYAVTDRLWIAPMPDANYEVGLVYDGAQRCR